MTYFKLKCFKYEQDPKNIKDFMPQNVTFCLPEGQAYSRLYSTVVSGPTQAFLSQLEVTTNLIFVSQLGFEVFI